MLKNCWLQEKYRMRNVVSEALKIVSLMSHYKKAASTYKIGRIIAYS